MEAAEQYADGNASEPELIAARIAAESQVHDEEVQLQTGQEWRLWAASAALETTAQLITPSAWIASTTDAAARSHGGSRTQEAAEQTALVRCIFGNPFKPTILKSSWLTPAVTQLAASIYDDRAFDRMPVLADALEESGCDDQEVLKHCRSGSGHVRGCYVVDLILGK